MPTPKAKPLRRTAQVPRANPASRGQSKERSGAQSATFRSDWRSYLQHHRKVARESVRRLLQSPLASLLTWAVIGVALALPTALSVLLGNVQNMSTGWDGAAQISVYLTQETSEADGQALAERLAQQTDIDGALFISRSQALEEFKLLSGFGDVLDYLNENPLPHVIVIRPDSASATPEMTVKLQQQLQALSVVEQAKLDMQWVERLYAISQLLERGVVALALLLALAVILVIGNTIRLSIENRRDEIVVVKLVGATDGFVRRPFLYTGMWYGFGGAVVAFLFVQLSLWWLSGPVDALAVSYNSQFRLAGLDFTSTLLLTASGVLLGWLGAWFAVHRHLSAIEPT